MKTLKNGECVCVCVCVVENLQNFKTLKVQMLNFVTF